MEMFKLDLTSFLLVRRYIRRSPYFMYSVMRQSGSWIVTQPMRDTTWGFCPSDTFFIISISRRKSRLSLPFADTTKGMKSFLSNWQRLQCLSYLAIGLMWCKIEGIRCVKTMKNIQLEPQCILASLHDHAHHDDIIIAWFPLFSQLFHLLCTV